MIQCVCVCVSDCRFVQTPVGAAAEQRSGCRGFESLSPQSGLATNLLSADETTTHHISRETLRGEATAALSAHSHLSQYSIRCYFFITCGDCAALGPFTQLGITEDIITYLCLSKKKSIGYFHRSASMRWSRYVATHVEIAIHTHGKMKVPSGTENGSSEWCHRRTISGSTKNLSTSKLGSPIFGSKGFFKELIKVSQRTLKARFFWFHKEFFKPGFIKEPFP